MENWLQVDWSVTTTVHQLMIYIPPLHPPY